MQIYCPACGNPIDPRAEVCPKCGVRQRPSVFNAAGPVDPVLRDAASKKVSAGICAILLGSFGVHKFIYGATTPGVIMLVVTLATCGVGGFVMHIIGVIEGVIYLTKSDAEFYQTYVFEKKEWF